MMKKNDNGNKTFVRITNQTIFEKLEDLERKVGEFCESNGKEHEKISGKVKLALWTGGTALTLCGIVLGFLIAHITGKT